MNGVVEHHGRMDHADDRRHGRMNVLEQLLERWAVGDIARLSEHLDAAGRRSSSSSGLALPRSRRRAVRS